MKVWGAGNCFRGFADWPTSINFSGMPCPKRLRLSLCFFQSLCTPLNKCSLGSVQNLLEDICDIWDINNLYNFSVAYVISPKCETIVFGKAVYSLWEKQSVLRWNWMYLWGKHTLKYNEWKFYVQRLMKKLCDRCRCYPNYIEGVDHVIQELEQGKSCTVSTSFLNEQKFPFF